MLPKPTRHGPECEPFHLFEREIAEQYGIRPEGHPWLKMVRYHPNYADKPKMSSAMTTAKISPAIRLLCRRGDEIHEVAVGPVHAGVIEPGHFRFNCIGERVLHLEIQLGYQHRGVETCCCLPMPNGCRSSPKTLPVTRPVGHSLCHAQAMEALSRHTGRMPGPRIIRTIGLELERIANHVGDLGALSGDVAFLPPANYCGRMRGDFLNMSLSSAATASARGWCDPAV
jgi:hypothetical protein